MPTVIVIGGGVAGLTAAHELAERGFEVHVYESRTSWGGKARTQSVPGTGAAGRHDLPGEHGFRFYPRFYRHVIDMMKRTPLGDGSDASVDSCLRSCTEAGVALNDGNSWSLFHRRVTFNPCEILQGAEALFQQVGMDAADASLFGLKILQYLASSTERRLGEYEGMTWWEFLGGEGFSPRLQLRAGGLPRMLVAMDAKEGNARTIGNTSVQLMLDFTHSGEATDRTMGGPTSQMWIDPWIRLLKSLGVQFHCNERCTALNVAGGLVSGAQFASGRLAQGDQYVLAVPIESAQALMSDDLARLDPQCERLRAANIGRLVSWMVGIQFYLRKDIPLARGHMIFPDSPWALTAISQPQFWRETIGRFRDHFGNGEVDGLISVDISQWESPGKFIQKRALDCTKEEVKTEVWEQLKAALNPAPPGQQVLTDEVLHSWHLDDDLDYSAGAPPVNSSRLLVHPPGSWAARPEAASAVANLSFAGDYVRTYTDIASMEAACESGRRAANVILDRASSSAERVPIWTPQEPKEFDSWKKLDEQLFRSGRPHIFEIGGIQNAFQAANLLRRFSAFTGLSQLEDFFRTVKLTDLVGGFFDRFGPGR